jgi:hypothetical protein
MYIIKVTPGFSSPEKGALFLGERENKISNNIPTH